MRKSADFPAAAVFGPGRAGAEAADESAKGLLGKALAAGAKRLLRLVAAKTFTHSSRDLPLGQNQRRARPGN